ncbi:MAG: hypothetical protein ACK414_13555, partial [Gemmobacter sp.]
MQFPDFLDVVHRFSTGIGPVDGIGAKAANPVFHRPYYPLHPFPKDSLKEAEMTDWLASLYPWIKALHVVSVM